MQDTNTIIENAIDKVDFYTEYLPDIVFSSEGQADNVSCPFHDDDKPSLSLHLDKGGICYGCDTKFSGPIGFFQHWLQRDGKKASFSYAQKQLYKRYVRPIVSSAHAMRWNDALLTNTQQLKVMDDRAINIKAVKMYNIGWDEAEERFTLPIPSVNGWLTDIRKIKVGKYDGDMPKNFPYDWQTSKDKKARGEKTCGKGGILFPYKNLDKQKIILCEGEWDAVVLNINGFNALTAGGVTSWKKHIPLLEGKDITICFDADEPGIKAAKSLHRDLFNICNSVVVVDLPTGMDVTDYFVAGNDRKDFRKLLGAVEETKPDLIDESVTKGITTFEKLDDLIRPKNYGERGVIVARVTADKGTVYSVPTSLAANCSTQWGKACGECHMKQCHGNDVVQQPAGSPAFLEAIGASDKNIMKDFKDAHSIKTDCPDLILTPTNMESVSLGYISPPTRVRTIGGGGRTQQRFVSTCGDLKLNTEYALEGVVTKDPSGQDTIFFVDKAHSQDKVFDTFSPPSDKRIAELLSKFRPAKTNVEGILNKHNEINEILANNVTKIYGRPETHTAVNFTFFSPLKVRFQGDVMRSYIETIILGDTNTGKNAVLDALCGYYGAGIVVDSASSTRAGLLGSIENGYFSWGAYVRQHGRLIGLDEGTNLQEIMNTLRTMRDGKADYVKSGYTAMTESHVRSIILANDPQGYLAKNAFPVSALPVLFESEADVSRFSLAYFLRGEDTPLDIVNAEKPPAIPTDIKQDDFKELVEITWTLKEDNIIITKKATEEILKQATLMSKKYSSQIPLVQAASQRTKIVQWAASLACQQFNWDEDKQVIKVTSAYVKAAVKIVESHYDSPACQYDKFSTFARENNSIADRSAVMALMDKEKDGNPNYITSLKTMATIDFIGSSTFGDILMSVDTPSDGKYFIKTLMMNRCLKSTKKGYERTPAFTKLLRELIEQEEGSNNGNQI